MSKKGGKAPGGVRASKADPPGSLPEVGPGLYCCTFSLQVDTPGVYYVCSCYPYAYSSLQEHMGELQARVIQAAGGAPGFGSGSRPGSERSTAEASFPPPLPAARSSSPSFSAPSAGPLLPNMFRSLLSYSLCGHRCELVTITDFNSPQDVILQRECIVLTARVHPGETCASWIMQVLG